LNEILIVLLFLAVGYSSGILIGMFGIGGGLVFVPFLFYFLPVLGVPESGVFYSAIGTSLLSGAIASSNSALLHFKSKNTFPRKALLIAAGSVITAFITPFFVINVHSRILEIIFAVIMLTVAVRMFIEQNGNKKPLLHEPLKDGYLIILGLFVGVLSAFTGLGGGIVYVPAMIYLFLVDVKKSIGTSAIVTALTMISSAIAFLMIGGVNALSFSVASYVYIGAAIPLGVGAVLGSILGVKLTLRSSNVLIKKIFSMILLVVVIRILVNLY
jgi:uncharacterized protein